jgi:hypothetical protein
MTLSGESDAESYLVAAWRARGAAILNAPRWSGVRFADREDALGQALLELHRREFASELHARHALEQRYDARLTDLLRRRGDGQVTRTTGRGLSWSRTTPSPRSTRRGSWRAGTRSGGWSRCSRTHSERSSGSRCTLSAGGSAASGLA